MIILRQKIFGLTNDGGGTSSMDFYKKQKEAWSSAGGEAKLGKFTTWMQNQNANGNGIANQESNMLIDKSSYKGSTLRALPSSNTGVVGKSSGGGFTLSDPNKVRNTGLAAGITASQQATSNPNNKSHLTSSAYNSGRTLGFQQGQQSVGIKQGAINTWNNMSRNQQIATGVVGTALLAGGAALAFRNRNKRKKAERELELERARNRY